MNSRVRRDPSVRSHSGFDEGAFFLGVRALGQGPVRLLGEQRWIEHARRSNGASWCSELGDAYVSPPPATLVAEPSSLVDAQSASLAEVNPFFNDARFDPPILKISVPSAARERSLRCGSSRPASGCRRRIAQYRLSELTSVLE